MCQHNRDDDCEGQSTQNPVQSVALQGWHLDASIGDKHTGQGVRRLAWSGHVVGDNGIPEEKLKQQRDVAHHLDIDAGKLGNQPIFGQSRNADDGAQDRGQNDTNHRDTKRVKQANQDGAPISVLGGVGDQRFANRKSRLTMQKPKACRDIAHRQVVHGVVDQKPNQPADHANRQDLINNRAHTRIVPGQLAFWPGDR